jgi:hypothetical protein
LFAPALKETVVAHFALLGLDLGPEGTRVEGLHTEPLSFCCLIICSSMAIGAFSIYVLIVMIWLL